MIRAATPVSGALACLLMLTAAAVVAQTPPGGPPPAVTTQEVRTADVTPSSEFVGRTGAPKSFDARARVTGFVERVAFDEGQDVDEGQAAEAAVREARLNLGYSEIRSPIADQIGPGLTISPKRVMAGCCLLRP